MRIVLIGDIHAFRLMHAPWDLAGKAIAGQTNVWLRRRRVFDLRLMVPVTERIEQLQPDLILLSGDLTSIASRREFEHVATFLKPLRDRYRVIGIPGNHDRYTFTAMLTRRMERVFPGLVPAVFPDLRPLTDRWKLLCIDSAVPRVVNSRGRVGPRQLRKVREIFAAADPLDGLLILCHYTLGKLPGLPESPRSHRLEDEEELLNILAECPSRVIFVHGHVHRPWLWHRLEPLLSHVVDLNAGAPCQVGSEFPFGQGFWEINLVSPSARADGVTFIHHIPQPPKQVSPESGYVSSAPLPPIMWDAVPVEPIGGRADSTGVESTWDFGGQITIRSGR